MTTTVDLVVENGTIVTENQIFEGSIAIDRGKIAAVGAPSHMPPAAERIDAKSLHIMPGVIDIHVHFREPGMEHKEDWETGSRAAAMGGATTVFDMPNTNPAVDNVANFRIKQELAAAKSIVDYGIYGVITDDNIAELESLVDAGVCGFKLFLGNTTGNLPCPSDGAVLEAFEILARRGRRISIHAENSPILFWREDKLQRAGRNTVRDHLLARTDVVALEALSKSCILAEWSGARIHIVHESTSLSLPYIEFYKSRGVDLTVETLPNYLYCSIEDMESSPHGYKLRMNPPIREAYHQEPLWEALRSGVIDFLSTDHAPHAEHEKEGETIWDIACGFPGIESSLALMLTAVHDGRLDLNRCVQITSTAAARAWGLYGRKGTLVPGADGDLVLVDLNRKEVLSAERLSSRGKLSAYEGMEVTGWPVMTIRRGEVIMRDGEVVAEPGSGRMVETRMPAPAPRNLDKHLASLTT